MSFALISSRDCLVKCVLSRALRSVSRARSNASGERCSWDFTRLSSVITTVMKLVSSTPSSSKRLTVTPLLPSATA